MVMKNNQVLWFIYDFFFTERDLLNRYLLLQFIGRDGIFDVCHVFQFLKT